MPTVREPLSGGLHLSAVAVLVAVTIVGCTPSHDDPVDEDGYQAFVERIAEEARGAGATAEQQELIADAAATGGVSFADVESAIAATFACLEDVGVKHRRETDSFVGSFPVAHYSYYAVAGEMDDNTLELLGSTCMAQNSQYVELLYSAQPAMVAEKEAQFEKARPQFVACLEENGAWVEEGSTNEELQAIATALLMGVDNSGTGPDCLEIVGLIE